MNTRGSPWFQTYLTYFNCVEVCVVSIVFVCFILIPSEMVLCIALGPKYKSHVSRRLVNRIIVLSWLVSPTVAVTVWSLHTRGKLYYYMIADILVILHIIACFAAINAMSWKSIRKVSVPFQQQADQQNRNRSLNSKLIMVPALLVSSFASFNAIPDFVVYFHNGRHHENDMFCEITSLLWSGASMLEPLVYIFLNERVRGMAKVCVKRNMTSMRCLFTGRVQFTVVVLPKRPRRKKRKESDIRVPDY